MNVARSLTNEKAFLKFSQFQIKFVAVTFYWFQLNYDSLSGTTPSPTPPFTPAQPHSQAKLDRTLETIRLICECVIVNISDGI